MTNENTSNETEASSDNNAADEQFTVHVKGGDGTYHTETVNTEEVSTARLVQVAEDGDTASYTLEALTGEDGTAVDSFTEGDPVDLTQEHRTWFRTLLNRDPKA
jgi:hypothetical protein